MKVDNYARITGSFWTGRTGRRIRAAGVDAQVVALYLLTCHTRSPLGLFYLPIETIEHETGMAAGNITAAIAKLRLAGFCDYDEGHEMVWVPEMAGYQLAVSLSETDKRVKWVRSVAASLTSSLFYPELVSRWGAALRFDDIPASPLQGATKGLPSHSFPKLPTHSLGDERAADGGTTGSPPAAAPPDQGKKPKASRKKNATPLPAETVATETHRRLATEAGAVLEAEIAKFRDHHAARDSRFASWDAALCGWLRRAKEFTRRPPPVNETPGSERKSGTTGGLRRAGDDPKLGSPSAARAAHGWCRVHPGRAAVSTAGLCAECRDAAIQGGETASGP